MHIEYNRNLTISYMILEQNGQLERWEEKMLDHNKLKGVLFAECMEENEQKKLWYDITGKQGLDVVLEKNAFAYAELCNLIKTLYEIVEELESVLLEPRALLLLPECIFLEHATEQIYFCYYPGNEKLSGNSFLELMEYLLKKLSHEDERAVTLAYAIYDAAVRDTFCLSDLENLLHMPYEKEEADAGCEKIYKENIKKQEAELGKEHAKMKAKNDCGQWIKDMRMRIQEIFGGFKPHKEEKFIFEPEVEEEAVPSRPTVLLHAAGVPEGVLRYEGKNGECKDLMITEFPYVIGSGKDCEGYIPSNTISRIHARITQTEDVYFIEDLNSVNGTFVGGTLLNCKVRMSLQKNEIVVFADEKYRFV